MPIICVFKDDNGVRCKSQANFNIETEKSAKYCGKHKQPSMIDVVTKKCQFAGPKCNTTPVYNNPGEKKGKFCEDHKEIGMINIKSKRCAEPNCSLTQPTYNFPGEKVGKYCSNHAKENMVNVSNKKCSFKCDKGQSCPTIANYNYVGNSPEFCVTHKKDDMVNVTSKTCDHIGCSIQPTYNYSGMLPLYCKTHKEAGMENVCAIRCVFSGCSTQPSWGYPDEKASHCTLHKLDGMVSNYKKCKLEGCEIVPTFNFTGECAEWCEKHKTDGMINVKSSKCNYNGCTTQSNPKYGSFCRYCYFEKYPNTPTVYNYKIKESAFMRKIKDRYQALNPIFDKKIANGLSNCRPDCLLAHNDKIIMTEVDENGHKGYNNEDDRMAKLHKDLNYQKTVIIRVNPDKYTDKSGKKIDSCFGFNDDKKVVISDKLDFEKRSEKVLDMIQYYLDNELDEKLTIIYLYYDGYTGESIEEVKSTIENTNIIKQVKPIL